MSNSRWSVRSSMAWFLAALALLLLSGILVLPTLSAPTFLAPLTTPGPWTRVTSTSRPGWDNTLYRVAAVAGGDAWAVGSFGDFPLAHKYAIIERWDGISAWNMVLDGSNFPGIGVVSELHAVTATSASDVWAVGERKITGLFDPNQPLILHWDGTNWNIIANLPVLPAPASDFTERCMISLSFYSTRPAA